MKNTLNALICSAVILLAGTTISRAEQAHDHSKHIHHQHDHASEIPAPIGVMRDHVHEKNNWMVSYRFEYMFMGENKDGSSSVSDQNVLDDYMVTPTNMSMRMHMLGLMYGLTDTVTLGIMGGFMENDMDHRRRNLATFNRDTQGWSDTKLNVMHEFYNDGLHRFQLNGGLSLPTGTIDEKQPNGMRQIYPMQIGSGTYDFLPGLSYSGAQDDWAWGGQLNAIIRLGENDNNYTFGDRYQATAWGAKRMNANINISVRLNYETWNDIDGKDPQIGPPFMAPTMDPDLYGGERLEALAGFDYTFRKGALEGNRFAIEAGMPLYESLDGPRLAEDFSITFGWQKAF